MFRKADKTLRPGQAAKILNVSPETLRLWDEHGKLPFEVERTSGGERRYPAGHIHALADAISGKNPSDVLATMDDMVMLPVEQEISPGITEFRHSDGSISHMGDPRKIAAARAAKIDYLDPRKMQTTSADVPADWGVDAGLAAIALAHNPSDDPQVGQLDERGGPVIVLTMCVLNGPALGQLVDIRIPVDPSAAVAKLVGSLLGINLRRPPKGTKVTFTSILEAVRGHVYLASLDVSSVDLDWEFAPEGTTHCVEFRAIENRSPIPTGTPLTYLTGAVEPEPALTAPQSSQIDDG